MDSQATFNSNPYILASSIDLCQVKSLVGNMEQQTGMHSDSYTLKIIDHMNVMGLAAGQPINDTFDPSLVFKFDSVHFYLDTNTATDSPLHSSKAGLAGAAGLQANTLPIAGLKSHSSNRSCARLVRLHFNVRRSADFGMGHL